METLRPMIAPPLHSPIDPLGLESWNSMILLLTQLNAVPSQIVAPLPSSTMLHLMMTVSPGHTHWLDVAAVFFI